jgi:uncharacterized protein (TIGR02266 family)
MTEVKEKRRDPRVPLVLRVDHPGRRDAVQDATENLSAGGLFVRTDRTLVTGQRVPLQIGFPGLLQPLDVEVEVVRVRAAGPDAPAGVAVKIPIDRVDDRHKLARLAEVARAHAAPLKGIPVPSPRGYRVLVVEDNAHVVDMYDYALGKLRSSDPTLAVEVDFARNGHEALARLAEQPRIDLVMADLYMPVLDGFALVERMRADPSLEGIPIVVISAGGSDARARAVGLGVDVYLQKPVQFADIIGTVRTLLRIKG